MPLVLAPLRVDPLKGGPVGSTHILIALAQGDGPVQPGEFNGRGSGGGLGALAPAIELTARQQNSSGACNETTRGWPGRMRRGSKGCLFSPNVTNGKRWPKPQAMH